MRVRVLGAISVKANSDVPDRDMSRNGGFEVISSPRPRLILAMLASRYGSTVSESALTEAIWRDNPPTSVRTALQTYVSALRDVLEPDRPRRSAGRFVTRETRGYALRCEPGELDTATFEDKIGQAQKCHTTNRVRAIALLEDALRLWNDPPFGEYVDAPWAIGAATRLRDVHAAALESRFGLALDDGSEGDVLDSMESAVAMYPYRERLVGQRMLALYRRGEQQRALDQYKSTRHHLREDLGLDPGRELQLLEHAILTQDEALRTRTNSGAKDAALRLADLGGRKPLVGRDTELDSLTQQLNTQRCITIVGPGGAGKSLLAAHGAFEVADQFGQRVHFVDLADLAGRSPMRGIAAALQIIEHPLAPLSGNIVDAIGERPTLLVIETCELAVNDVAAAVSTILSAPGASILLTSQVPLQIQAEHVVRLHPLGPAAALELLTGTTEETAPADLAALTAIAQRVGHLPLGLELAASRLDALGPEELLRSLTGTATPSVSAGTDRPNRHRSVRAAVEWSLNLLDEPLRQTLTRFAAFSAPFSVDAASAITDDPGSTSTAIAILVDRSLIERLPGRPTRFRLPDPVRSAVADGSNASEVQRGQAQLAAVTSVAAQANLFGTHPVVSIDQLHGEVVPTLQHFARHDDSQQLALAGMLGLFFIESGRISEGREQLTLALEAHPQAPMVIRVLTASQLSFLTWYQGDLIETRRVLHDVINMLDDVQIPGIEPVATGCLAFIEGRFPDAASELTSAIELFPDNPKQHLFVLHMAGNASWYAGRPTVARGHYRTQRDVAQSNNNRFHLAQALRFEAMVAAILGDIEPAWRWAERSRSMAKSMADPVSLAQSSAASAVVAMVAGVESEAVGHAVDALQTATRHFDVFALRTSLPILAEASNRKGDTSLAAQLLGWYLDLLDRTGQTPSPATADLADATTVNVRDALGPSEFARLGAQGAARRLTDIVGDL